MGKFSKFLGKVAIKVADEDLELDIKVADVQKLLDLSKEKDISIEKQVNGLTDIMVKSYPDEEKEALEAFVLKNLTTLMQEITIGLGWASREQIEKAIKEEMDKKKPAELEK